MTDFSYRKALSRLESEKESSTLENESGGVKMKDIIEVPKNEYRKLTRLVDAQGLQIRMMKMNEEIYQQEIKRLSTKNETLQDNLEKQKKEHEIELTNVIKHF
jgi:hypothetical protein